MDPGIPTPNNAVALDAVRAQAEASANHRGASLHAFGLRLFAEDRPVTKVEQISSELDPSPYALGRTYELALASDTRRRTGAHLTPEQIARQLVGLLPDARPEHRVLDPAVGGAAFLLAAADDLLATGATPDRVLNQLYGFDIDPGAVAVAEAALALWALDNGIAPRALPQLQVGDGLLSQLPEVERVVGNPPFLNQLRSSSWNTAARRAELRERWGGLVGAYTDDAWLFLAAGVDCLRDGGSIAMVQPVSVLAARHASSARSYVHDRSELEALWVARDRVFDAAVQVCGVVATRRDVPRANTPVRRLVGATFEACEPLADQPSSEQWAAAAAATMGVPTVTLAADRTVSDLATATAGFRDQFYGFIPFVAEQAGNIGHRLVTVGMIDVLTNNWGTREFPFAKRSFTRPTIDVDSLRAEDPKLGEWVDARLRPKLLLATQTRVAELWVDTTGDAIPATPVLSIEPLQVDDNDDLWLLAAAMSAPAVSASFLATNFGTAMSLNAMKLAARDVLATPLPTNESPWRRAVAIIRQTDDDRALTNAELTEFAEQMGLAYGVTDASLVSWWLERLPKRSPR